ncbi:MAG: DUF4907 domain-containing protein [Lutibacter sp.]|nr:DUF4907 domain-containing protein [Lutibacter sp.]
MKKWIFIFTVLIITAILVVKLGGTATSTNDYKLETFMVNNGWGYSILKKDKVIIKQDIIPGIQVKKPFATKKDAVIIGELMIEKLKNKKIPSITYKELQINGVIL